jgi:CheY-like chemotaxis protein
LLAGRKLLLADDSITIQKVVELTFADEGVQVISVGNGTEAIERLEEMSPDIVLADVFMPGMTGYQVCEHIKQSDRLRHVPVMLLVGFFEPFDEAEARRVGADDILTKPFQSIRNLVNKVSGLLRGETGAERTEAVSLNPPEGQSGEQAFSTAAQDEARTTELPRPVVEAEAIQTEELELMTADTRQLSPEMLADTQPMELAEDHTIKIDSEEKMETETHIVTDTPREVPLDYSDVLLDLGKFEPIGLRSFDDAILDLDLDSPAPEMFRGAGVQTMVAEESQVESTTAAEKEAAWVLQDDDTVEFEAVSETGVVEFVEPAVVEETVPAASVVEAEAAVSATDQAGLAEPVSEQVEVSLGEPAAAAPPAPLGGQITLEQLAPEVIEAIARRAVAQLSEKAVQEIAWEVVPQLAELLIKRRLEEKETQAH